MAKAAGLIGTKMYKLVTKKRTSIGDSCRSRPTNKHQRRQWKAYRGGEIEHAMTALARPANGGLIVSAAAAQRVPRDVIIKLAAQYRLPAVYAGRDFVTLGGLMSFDPDRVDQYRRAAAYVDRILRGEKPADLPVQAPTKYELIINLKTAKALGLDVPPTLLARADEVIE